MTHGDLQIEINNKSSKYSEKLNFCFDRINNDLVILDDEMNLNNFANSDRLNEKQFTSEIFELFNLCCKISNSNIQLSLCENASKLIKEDSETEENLYNTCEYKFRGMVCENDNLDEFTNKYFIDFYVRYHSNWNIIELDKANMQKYDINENVYHSYRTFSNCCCKSHYNSNISCAFLSDLNILKYYNNKVRTWNKLIGELQKDIVYERNQCFSVFDHPENKLNRSLKNQDKYLLNRSEVVSFQFQFYLYIILFNFCCLEIICNQISHVENSVSLQDSRLSNIMQLAIDICHILFTMIPFFCLQYDYDEIDICERESPIKMEDNKYVFGFITIYIICFFTFICLQRLILLKQKELKSWYHFLKFLFFIFLLYFICANFVLDVILKFGIPNCLFSINIICNIISKKTVTEGWLTASIKLILYNLTPINSTNNFKYQFTGFEDFIKYFASGEYHQILIVSANQSVTQKIQNLAIQIGLVSILFLQKKYGSLFFLPSCLRSRKFDKMKRDKRKMNNEYINRACHYCVNLLWQRELNYSDNCNEELNVNDSNLFYETECGYVYHSRCFYKYLKSFKNCPDCRNILPKDGWDD